MANRKAELVAGWLLKAAHDLEEALNCFLRTKMDVLVLGRYFVEKGEHGAGSREERARSGEQGSTK